MAEQYGVDDGEGFRWVTMLDRGLLQNAAATTFTLGEARTLYTVFSNPSPPFPNDAATFYPCSILSTGMYTDPGGGPYTGPCGALYAEPPFADAYHGPWSPCITDALEAACKGPSR